jgi:superfamily II DNA or RNA helicase
MSYLRPYQGDIRDKVLAVLSNGCESTLYVQPTGTGKTEVALDVIDQWPDKSCQVLCLAHRQELIWQPWNRWQTKTGDYAEIEMGEQRRGRRSRVTFASKDSLHPDRLRTSFPDPRAVKLIWIDEAHHVVKKTRSYGHILDYFRQGNPDLRIFGCTATPDRTDEHALGQTFQTVAAEYPLLDPAGGPSAITDGWLVPIQQHVVVCEGISFEKVKTRGKKGDFVEGDLEKMLLENEVLEAICGATRSVAAGKTTLCFTSGIHQAIKQAGIFHAEQTDMARAIASAIPPELYHDYVIQSNDHEARKHMLKSWARGEFQYVCNVGVFTEGMDEPRIAVISMGRPTKSRALYAQMAGRGTRVLPGLIEGRREDGTIWRLETREQRLHAIQGSAKPFLTILDFVGVSRHSLVSAVDILGGKYDDEIVEAARSRIASGERDVQQALARAAEEAVLEARKSFKAKVDFRLQTVDPFALFNVIQAREPGWHRGRMATPKQQEALIKFGMDRRTVAKLSFHKASQLMDTFIKRIKEQQCSYRQAKVLAKAGVDPEQVGFKQASAIIDRIKRGGEVTIAEDVINRIRSCKTAQELTEVAQAAKQLKPIYQPAEWEDIVLAGKAKREHLDSGVDVQTPPQTIPPASEMQPPD